MIFKQEMTYVRIALKKPEPEKLLHTFQGSAYEASKGYLQQEKPAVLFRCEKVAAAASDIR